MLIDGQPRTELPADDRGLAYGDGLFETVYWDGRCCPLWTEHMDRIAQGAQRLGLPAPGPELWAADLAALAPGAHPAVIKLMLTRGSGARGYRPPSRPVVRRIVSRADYPDWPRAHWEAGIRVRRCTTTLAIDPVLAGLKHLNRLPQVLARAEWSDPDVAEGLMFDAGGHLVCATQGNVFVVRGDRLCTPALTGGGVAGVARACLMTGMPVEVVDLDAAALAVMDAAFITNALIGVWPVRDWCGRELPTHRLVEQAASVLRTRGLPC